MIRRAPRGKESNSEAAAVVLRCVCGGGGYLGCFLSASEVSLAPIPGQPRRVIASRWRQSKYLKAKQASGGLPSASHRERRDQMGKVWILKRVLSLTFVDAFWRGRCRSKWRVMKRRQDALESPHRGPLVFTGSCCNTSALVNFHPNRAKHHCIIFWENKARGTVGFV